PRFHHARLSSAYFFPLFFFLMIPRSPSSTLFPYTTLFRSSFHKLSVCRGIFWEISPFTICQSVCVLYTAPLTTAFSTDFLVAPRSEEHTSELQSRENLVCRLLLEKKKKKTHTKQYDTESLR